jgi:outer membrane lipoprotein-sorting protein
MISQRLWLKQTTAAIFFACLGAITLAAQQIDAATVIREVDAAVKARIDHLQGYTVTEHYAVFRGKDDVHPAAEMTVKTVYQKETGKNYTVLSQSGSEFIRKHVLNTLLDDEKEINLPGIREHSWITSANYEMKLKTGATEQMDGRNCVALAITPRRKAPNMIEGTLWVDALDGSIVRLEGTTSQSPSIFTDPAKVMRRYVNMNGFGMATQARAVSESFLLGRTTVVIDYRDYQIQLGPAK